MTALVIGELTADASTIILMGTGPEHEVAQAAAKLQTLTPLIKPTDPAGALQLPATWARRRAARHHVRRRLAAGGGCTEFSTTEGI